MGTHIPCGITQCYLPPSRGDIPTLTPAEAGTVLLTRILLFNTNERHNLHHFNGHFHGFPGFLDFCLSFVLKNRILVGNGRCPSCWPSDNVTALSPAMKKSQMHFTLSLFDCWGKKVKVAHTRLPSIGFRSWSRFLAVSLQVTWVINPAVGCHYFPPGLQLPPQPLRGLLRVLLLGEQRNDGCEQFA